MQNTHYRVAITVVVLAGCRTPKNFEASFETVEDAGSSTGEPEGTQGEEPVVEQPSDVVPWPSIAYWGTFDWEDALPAAQSYVFENDLGFTFRVDTFRVAITSIQLLPCTTEHATEGEEARAVGPLGWTVYDENRVQFFDTSENDASVIAVGRAEDAFSTSVHEFGVGVGGEQPYCGAFWLSAPLLDPDPLLETNSIWIVGAYQPPAAHNEEDWVAFDAAVALTGGTVTTLVPYPDDSLRPSEGDANDVNIIATRYPARAFDSLDPQELSDLELAWEALRNVLQDSTVSYAQR